jgi:hypothetical protein
MSTSQLGPPSAATARVKLASLGDSRVTLYFVVWVACAMTSSLR